VQKDIGGYRHDIAVCGFRDTCAFTDTLVSKAYTQA
jgi:hypothetical protein